MRLKNARTEGDYHTATVMQWYKDIKGGVILDRRLAGFYSWNVSDLRRVKPKPKT